MGKEEEDQDKEEKGEKEEMEKVEEGVGIRLVKGGQDYQGVLGNAIEYPLTNHPSKVHKLQYKYEKEMEMKK